MKILFLSLFIFSSFLYSYSDTYSLEVELAKIQSKLQSAKLVLNGTVMQYRQAIIDGTSEDIQKYRLKFSDANKLYNNLSIKYKTIIKQIKQIKAKKVKTTVGKIVNRPSIKSVKLFLSIGWNAFSIPVNKQIESSYFGNYLVIWGFNSSTQKWIKNPKILLPSKGYYIYIGNEDIAITLSGLSFTTDLGSIVREDKTWYFIGASEDINNIDYKKYKIIKYEKDIPTINPISLKVGDTFWAYRL